MGSSPQRDFVVLGEEPAATHSISFMTATFPGSRSETQRFREPVLSYRQGTCYSGRCRKRACSLSQEHHLSNSANLLDSIPCWNSWLHP